jgi:predicted site-specific integrase-resolvase
MKTGAPLMTTKQFAEKMGVDYRTALNWLKAGLVPKAKRRSSLAGTYWEIPESALEMERPKPGPKTSKRKVK